MSNMVPESIYSSRIILGEPFAEDSTRMFYRDLAEQYGIQELPLVMCNSLQRKTCLSYVNGISYLIFDTSVTEIFHLLHKAVAGGSKDEFLKTVFYLVSSEQYFAEGQYALALQFAAKYLNSIENAIDVMAFEEDKDYPSPLFIQQAFLLSHEVYHYWLSLDNDRYKRATNAKQKMFGNIYNYAQKELGLLLGKSFADAITNRTLIEECICDSMGALSAIDIGFKLKKQNGVQTAIAIIESLNCQFILSCIQSFNEQINRKISFSEMNEFNFRLLHLKTFLSRTLREDFGDVGADEFEDAMMHSDNFINNTIQRIGEMYSDESLALKYHFDSGDSVSIDVREQLLKIYSL